MDSDIAGISLAKKDPDEIIIELDEDVEQDEDEEEEEDDGD